MKDQKNSAMKNNNYKPINNESNKTNNNQINSRTKNNEKKSKNKNNNLKTKIKETKNYFNELNFNKIKNVYNFYSIKMFFIVLFFKNKR